LIAEEVTGKIDLKSYELKIKNDKLKMMNWRAMLN